jgi:hypothetical protein
MNDDNPGRRGATQELLTTRDAARKAVSAPPRGSRQPMFWPFRPCLACWNGARSPSEVGIRGISDKIPTPGCTLREPVTSGDVGSGENTRHG